MPAYRLAANLAATEHIAIVNDVKWAAADGSACIIVFRDGCSGKAKVSHEHFTMGCKYKFQGRWGPTNAKYGDQFVIDTFELIEHGGQAGVCNYLVKFADLRKPVAERLWMRFGDETVKVLRERYAECVGDKLLTEDEAKQASETLTRHQEYEGTRIELYGLLKSRGFHSTIYQAILNRWGKKAPATIRRDPFKLLGMPGAGFVRCDKMWREIGLPTHRLKRQVWCLINELRNGRDGHTWIDYAEVRTKLNTLFNHNAKPDAVLSAATRVGLIASYFESDSSVGGSDKLWITLGDRYQAERSIAANIERLSRTPNRWPESIPVSTVEGDRLPSTHQAKAWADAALSPVTCLIGGPGVGKSHVVAYVIREIRRRNPDAQVVCCAPTGKAAVRMTQSMTQAGLTLSPAQTIHRLLGVRNGAGGDGGRGGQAFEHGRNNPLECDYLIVDESSMIDTHLMSCLLDACDNHTHVLFVGDTFQLPPVGHGAPLRDIIAACNAYGQLSEVRRNAGRIVTTCHAIKDSQAMKFSEKLDLDAGENLLLVDVEASQVMDTILDIIELGIKQYDRVRDTQVIVALNEKGACNRDLLNRKIQQLLNPDGYTVDDCKFRVGDKVICTSNRFATVYTPEFGWARDGALPTHAHEYRTRRPAEGMTDMYVANGEIGRVIAVGKFLVVRFGESQQLVRCELSEGVDLSYAVTCHKMQGSESPVVIIAVDPAASSIADRSWHYTAISRASKACVVVGPLGTIRQQVIPMKLTRRVTWLAEMLRYDFPHHQVVINQRTDRRRGNRSGDHGSGGGK